MERATDTLKGSSTDSLVNWRVGGGASKLLVELDFSSRKDRSKTKIHVSAPSQPVLKSISIALWEIMQCAAAK